MSAASHDTVGSAGRKFVALAVVFAMVGGAFIALPQATQNATGYATPGMGMMLTFMDLSMMSGGAVEEIGLNQFLVHETITVMPSDTLMLTGMEDVFFDPFVGISLEILGNFDAMTGFGALLHSAGPGAWDGIRVMGMGMMNANDLHVQDAVTGIHVQDSGSIQVNNMMITNTMMYGIFVQDSGAVSANSLMIWGVPNGIHIDHSAGFGSVQITGCNIDNAFISGITMIGTMGGPMVSNNWISGSQTGFRLVSTTAQCQNNEVMNCQTGFYVEGNPGPGIFGNRIHDNAQSAIYVEDASTWINSNTIRDNGGDAIVLFNSTAGIDGNEIFAWNATLGSGENGRDGVRINGSVEWGQNWISQNSILGGNGDGPGSGGHAIYIEEFIGNPLNQPNIENTAIENNLVLRGGRGGDNTEDWGAAGHGGSGVHIGRLPDDGDWGTDNHGVKVSGNTLVTGGDGGFDHAGMGGRAGDGGHGVCVDDDNNAGSILVSGNTLILGGRGGDTSSPMGWPGDGGHGVRVEDCGSGAREDVRDSADIRGGEPGIGPSGLGHSGCAMSFFNSAEFHVSNVKGRSAEAIFDITECNGGFTLRDVSATDSGASLGHLVRAESSSSTGTNINWNFRGADRTDGVVVKNCTMLSLTGGNITVSNATAMEFRNSGNISLDDLSFNVTDGNGLVMNWTWNVDLFNLSMEMWWVDPFEIDYGLYIEDSDDVDVGGLVMKWDQKDSPGGGYSSAWKYSYKCEDSSNCTVSNSTLTGGKAKADKCHNVRFVDSFFDVFYNTTDLNNTGISVVNTTGATIINTRVNVTNATGMKAENCNGAFIVDSFFDVHNTSLPGNFTGVDIFKSNNTRVQNTTVKTKNATGMKNFKGNNTFVIDSFFDITYEMTGGGPGISILESFDVGIEGIRMLVRNATGINITNSSRVNLGGITIDGSESTDPDGPCRGIESYYWKLGGIYQSNVTGTKGDGVNLTKSDNLNITGNNVSKSGKTGIKLSGCNNVNVYHNNIMNNAIQASDDTGTNSWHDGYPSGGNYWSDYAGPDLMSGPLQNIPGPDWIGDIPYSAIAGGTGTEDSYPLARPTIEGRIQHLPFRINSNADFDWEHGVVNWATGDGSEGNPWVIENWNVNGTATGYCIYIGNTTSHFILQNCHLHDTTVITFDDTGLSLVNVTAGFIINNTISFIDDNGIFLQYSSYNVMEGNVLLENGIGILLDDSSNNTIEDNFGYKHSTCIFVYESDGNIIRHNYITGGWGGIHIRLSNNNTATNNSAIGCYSGFDIQTSSCNFVSDNNISENWYGFMIYSSSTNNTLISNIVSQNGKYGVYIDHSSGNTVVENRISNNDYGTYIEFGTPANWIYHNNFIGNIIHAYDRTGLNNWHDGYPSGGNYWSDYVGPDLMSGPLQNIPGPDGIGDVPYVNIQGGAGAEDRYPLMAPWTPPPLSFFNISLSIGWNLISIPLELEDTDIANVLASISGKYDSVKSYDTLDFMDPWKSYRQNGTVNDLVAIDNTVGVWVHATEGCTLAVSGYVPISTAIPLYAGWNLVAYPNLAPMAVQDALFGVAYDRIECFDPVSPYIREMLPPEMMMPGHGYWVHVPADTIWLVDW